MRSATTGLKSVLEGISPEPYEILAGISVPVNAQRGCSLSSGVVSECLLICRRLRGGFGVPLFLSLFLAQPFGFLLLLLDHVPLAPLEIVVHAAHEDWEPRFSRFACRFSFIELCAFFFTFFFASRPLLMPRPFVLAFSADRKSVV